MHSFRFVPAALASVVILGSGCARGANSHSADSAASHLAPDTSARSPMSNAAGQTDNYNARTSATDTGAALGTTNDTIASRGAPQPSDTTHKRP